MRVTFRRLTGITLAALVPSVAAAKNLPNYDASAGRSPAANVPFTPLEADKHLLRPGAPVHVDGRFGVPAFLWAADRSTPPGLTAEQGRARAEQAARRHLADFASIYRLDGEDVRRAEIRAVHDTGRGAVIVSFRQTLGGIEVFRDEIKVAMGRELGLISISGHIPSVSARAARGGPRAFKLDAHEAIAIAMRDFHEEGVEPLDLRRAGEAPGGYETYEMNPRAHAEMGLILLTPSRAKRVLFHLPDRLEPAWYIELNLGSPDSTESDYYSYVISAEDGRLLFRNNLTAVDSFTYRVWAETTGQNIPYDGPQASAGTPHPTGLPDGFQAPFSSPGLITLQNGPISTNDPWLAPGATVTNGNNADAYADLTSPDGFTLTDFRASTTSAGTFDRTYDTALSPIVSTSQQMASITQLFYNVNFLHDWHYDSGFDEASGNAQASNYGRGGLGGDSMRAEAQDFSGRNNANMQTPSDGGRPIMQMYVFDGVGERRLTVNSPAGIAGNYIVGTAQFGPQTFTRTADMVLVNDGSGAATDACETPFANAAAVSGKIAFIDRGTCAFTVKVKNAQLNGATAAVIANNVGTGVLGMSGTDAGISTPSLFISQADGDTIRAQFGVGVNATMVRGSAVDRDGTIDNQIVAHEWGHYISNRLIGNGNGLYNQQGGGMGEGWGDFHALMMTVRPEDANAPGNADFSGVYGLAAYVTGGPGTNNSYYYGIRRVPYSTDFTKNPLTFRHIENGVALPTTAPIAFGADGSSNAEVHNAGEVWATMLWECYASLLRDTGRLSFDQARDRMRDYLVAAYKLTPDGPTFLEARDAVLATAFANDPNDFALFYQAFARRGAGVRAVAPDRLSTTNAGVVESYAVGGDLTLVGAVSNDDVAFCDEDGILDDGETGHLVVTLRNTGSNPLTATTATVTSPDPGVTFPGGNSIAFPASQPYGTTSAPIEVALSGVTGIQVLDFNLSLDDPGLAIPGPLAASTAQRANYDLFPNASASDDVESDNVLWTPAGDPNFGPSIPWQRLTVSGADHRFFGSDPSNISSQSLISPILNVAPSGNFVFTFRSRYYFENSAGSYYDGGVLEISPDNGANWYDIGAAAFPGYSATIASGGGNPLGGFDAFAGISPGYPAFHTVTVNLETFWAGQSVRIRFRIGTDVAAGAPGWEVDDIAFSNITNLPFDALLPDDGLCVNVDSDLDGVSDASDCSPSDPGLWGIPSGVEDLTLVGTAPTNLSWSPPPAPGGVSLVYDLIRGPSPSSFSGALCLESDETDRVAVDATVPSPILYYLVRVENSCGSNLGARSDGTPHTGVNCP